MGETMSEPLPQSEQPYIGSGAAVAWAEVPPRLADADGYWLATTRADGRPHLVPLLAVWDAGRLHFAAGAYTRKARNLAAKPDCVLTTRQEGLDLVVEGAAAVVRDEAVLQRVADTYASKYDWSVTVRDGAFHGEGAPTAGPGPYDIYAVTPTVVFAFPVDERYHPTRWTF
jgi:nitroimidazol reductase NimA-like FMN-containing flavoprotein (pyridoxamine 5'-phosphate oxidase superfamily)